MSAIRLASLFLTALVLLCQSATSGETKSDKYRVELNSGERFVLQSGILTSDSLVGTGTNGQERFVPIGEIRSLQRGNGTYARKGAALGALVGSAIFILNFVESKDKEPDRSSWGKNDTFPFRLIGFIGGGTLLGAGIGLTIDKWEAVAPGVRFGGRTNGFRTRVQFTLSF